MGDHRRGLTSRGNSDRLGTSRQGRTEVGQYEIRSGGYRTLYLDIEPEVADLRFARELLREHLEEERGITAASLVVTEVASDDCDWVTFMGRY